MTTDAETSDTLEQSNLEQLRLLLRTLKAQFGPEILYREVRLILGETAGGASLIEGADRLDLMAEAAEEERAGEARRMSAGQRAQAAWDKALERASGETGGHSRGQGRDTRSQAEFERAKRQLGG